MMSGKNASTAASMPISCRRGGGSWCGTGADSSSWSAYRDELEKVSHREFSAGFFFNAADMNGTTKKSYTRNYMFLGTVGDPVAAGGTAAGSGRYRLRVKNQIKPKEDVIEFIGPDTAYISDPRIRIFDEAGSEADQADHGKLYTIEPSVPVKPGYILRKRLYLPEHS